MAAQEISPIPSYDSEERDRGSDTLTVSPVVLQNHVKLLHEFQQLMISSVGICPTTELAGSNVLLFFIGLDLGFTYFTRNIFVDLKTYIRTVAVVLEAYALLLLISTRYIRIAIIPVIILVFIGALCSKFMENRHRHRREVTLQNCAQPTQTQKLMKMAMIPYGLQLSFVIWTQLKGQQGGIFILSHFLLFFSSTLGALAVMVATPPIVVSPGGEQVLPVLRKTCIVMLLITIHTMAAEWLGEDVILVCMPELIAVLVWFTIRFDHAGHAVSVNSVTSLKSGVIILSSVVAILAYLTTIYANDTKILASWYRRALWISIPSSALSHFDVWMLHQWPRSTSDSKGPIELLKFSTKICLCTTAILCVMSVARWVLDVDEDEAIPVNTLVAVLPPLQLLFLVQLILLFLVRWSALEGPGDCSETT